MVTELQYIAIAAYLTWCLVSSLCDMFTGQDDALHAPETPDDDRAAGGLIGRR